MATNQPYSPQNVSENQMFINALIDMKAVEGTVVQMFPQFNMWNMLAKKYNAPKMSMQKQLYQMERIGNTYVGTDISTSSLVNGVMTITFSNNQYSGFRRGDITKAASGVYAYVTSASAGTLTQVFQASPIAGVTAFDGAVDFLAGEAISSRGDARNVNDPNMIKPRLVEEPTPFYNYIGMMSDTAAYNATEGWEKTYLDNVGGKTYQIDNQLKSSMLRIAMNYAVRCYDSIGANQGGVITSDGIEQQIKKGGGYTTTHSGAHTESSLQALIDGMIENGGLNGNKVAVVCGNRWIGGVQRNVLKQYVTTAGNTNTFEISKGIDGYYYQYNGLTLEIYPDPLFLNTNAFPRSTVATIQQYANSAYFISSADVVTNNGTRPFMTQRYFGPTDMIITQSNSILDENGNVRQGAYTDGQLAFSKTVIYNKNIQLENPASCAVDTGTN